MGSESADKPRFVIGLGNPGREYAGTRHNVGFMVIDELVRRWDLGRGKKAFGGRLYDGRVGPPGTPGPRVLLLKPHTYMNRSGRAVRDLTAFHRGRSEDVLVVMDDIALPLGRIRARARGSSGGHKGLADVMSELDAEDVARLRVGVGAPPPPMDAVDYVLQRFAREELATVGRAVRTAADAVGDWLVHGTTYVMDAYNRAEEPDPPAS